MASDDYERRRKRLSYDSLREESKEEEDGGSKFVDVPVSLKGHVIGKGGHKLHEIMETTGTTIFSQSKEEAGFTIFGDEDQTAHAERLIKGIVDSAKRRRRELIKVEDKFKGSVKGKEAAKLRHISAQSGARVILDSEDLEIYIISGTEEEREYAKVLIGEKVALARMRGVGRKNTKTSCCIDDYNLNVPKLKLEQVLKNGHPTGPLVQYRLKPAEQCKPQEPCTSDAGHPSYKEQLMKDVLVSLRKVKQEMTVEMMPKADMWCHFGKVTIQVPDREDVRDGRWSIREATEKIKYPNNKHWKLAFNLEGVTPNERALRTQYKETFPEEIGYVSRHDLTFLTPCWYQLRCKVWVANENSRQRLEEIPIPFDVKNILGEIHFKDEDTRSKCRGWLVLKSLKYLRADILFPGCEFDCRFHIRGRRGRISKWCRGVRLNAKDYTQLLKMRL